MRAARLIAWLTAAVAAAAAAGGCSAGAAGRPRSSRHAPPTASARSSAISAASTGRSPQPGARHHARRRLPVDPGRLPQTNARPSAATAAFRREMRALWTGVRSGRLGPAMAAFFPEPAYAQVKAISDPAADWRSRLVGEYALDLAAAHALLGSGAAQARLLGVRVPAAYAHWVAPGACYNRIGYWEVPNARVVYREQGAVRSFGIASMISWRGVWYVVHLGAVLRSGAGGEVDDPSSGPGVSAYSGTC
jgi:hypothetical protein